MQVKYVHINCIIVIPAPGHFIDNPLTANTEWRKAVEVKLKDIKPSLGEDATEEEEAIESERTEESEQTGESESTP